MYVCVFAIGYNTCDTVLTLMYGALCVCVCHNYGIIYVILYSNVCVCFAIGI